MSAKDLEFLSNFEIEGQLLADRLAEGELPPEEALRYAIDIGVALTRAHTRGVVHGQISPHAVLLAGGRAHVLQPAESRAAAAAAYRSPEQVQGQAPDWRSDIFSYGALLYELAAGKRAFPAEGEALPAAILEQKPATIHGRSPIHAAMEGVVASCIEKDPERRRQRIQNAVIELKLAGRALPRIPAMQRHVPRSSERQPEADTIEPVPRRPRSAQPLHYVEIQVPHPETKRRRALVIGLGLAALIATAMAIFLYLSQKPGPVYKFPIAPPEKATYRGPAISPDGKYVTVSEAGPEGKLMLWLRPLDAVRGSTIPGTEGAVAPFWSPDSEYIAFFADQALKKVRVSGGPVEKICDAEAMPGGGTWSPEGVILFAPSDEGTLYQVPAAGGKPQPVLSLNSERFERAHLWPQFLPDGKHFIFFVLSDLQADSGVCAGVLGSKSFHMLFQSETNAVYSPVAGSDSSRKGYLIYIRERSLMAQPFNASALETTGDAINLAEDVGPVRSLSLAPVSVSDNAILVYQGIGKSTRQLAWMDRSGKTIAAAADAAEWGPPRVSPDGTRGIAAKAAADGTSANLWMIDRSGNDTQFTFDHAVEGFPIWSPDGGRIVYFSNIGGSLDLYVRSANGNGKAELLFHNEGPKYPTDWSRDGRFIFFGTLSEGTLADVWGLSVADRHPAPVLDTVYSEGYAALSPDGKWLAYQSDETRRNEVYVQAFDGLSNGTKRRWKISADGGGLPRWRADGRELFFMTNSGRMMSAVVRESAGEFAFDTPQILFQTRPIPGTWNLYDVAPDGQRFLMNVPLEWATASPITVVTNWTEKLKPSEK